MSCCITKAQVPSPLKAAAMPKAPEMISAVMVEEHCTLKFMLRAAMAISTEVTAPKNNISDRTLSIGVISASSKKTAINGDAANIAAYMTAEIISPVQKTELKSVPSTFFFCISAV